MVGFAISTEVRLRLRLRLRRGSKSKSKSKSPDNIPACAAERTNASSALAGVVPIDMEPGLTQILAMPKTARGWDRFAGVVEALVSRLRSGTWDREREYVEDALKCLHEHERGAEPCPVAELRGRLGLGAEEGEELAERLVYRRLATRDAGGLRLTSTGRAYARRVLRTHRLWERYLADRTAVPAGEWHAAAERVEHELTPAEAERLASRLGDPRYDPHGDPIPTARGEMPAAVGVPLTSITTGRVVVTHLEDEPPAVFDRLLAAGLTPGLAVEVLGAAAQGGAAEGGRVRLRVRGEEHALGVEEAANVTVEVLPADALVPGRRRTLAEVGPGVVAVVSGIAPSCQGPQRRRLLDLGVVPGTRIEAELVSPSGDPVAYRLRGALIALRREQAEWIEVEGES
jgi:DtxR family transcriptional regulator, Mn-dependent transcriptional regulator